MKQQGIQKQITGTKLLVFSALDLVAKVHGEILVQKNQIHILEFFLVEEDMMTDKEKLWMQQPQQV